MEQRTAVCAHNVETCRPLGLRVARLASFRAEGNESWLLSSSQLLLLGAPFFFFNNFFPNPG